MIRVSLAACVLAAGVTAAAASQIRSGTGVTVPGPAKEAIERWFTGEGGPVCTDADGSDGACDLGRVLAMRVHYGPGAGHALAFATYSPAVSNASAITVGQFHRGERGWEFVRTLSGVYGEGPDSLSFDAGKATFAMNAPLPGDGRCCPSGRQRYTVDLATGAVTAGPKAPAAATLASGRGLATRSAGYEGATYFHNGSSVLVDERAGTIRYCVPRPGMRGVVRKGSLLFEGTFAAGGSVAGTAYAFKAGCEPAPYAVTGTMKGSGIVLRGMAPRRAPDSCAVTGTSGSGGHAVLRFREYGDL